MKLSQLIFWIGLILFSSMDGLSQSIPQTEVNNGLIKARIYLPDIDKGYYRATRFDWSGIMPNLEYDGHSFFGKWFKDYNPLVHESVMGPVEEFTQLGYKEAAIGESFLKIGVGMLVKPEESKYNNFKRYEIDNPGKWEVSRGSDKAEFKHSLNDPKFSYEYVKLIHLPEGKSEMILNHKFTNLGESTIDTQVYNHNFFMIDSLNIGPGYVVKLPFDIVAEGRVKGIGKFAEIHKKEIRFIENLQEGNQVYIEFIKGYSKDSETYTIHVENRTTRAGVKIHCNQALSKLSFWSMKKTLCPEPFIRIKADPGETISWKITYTFYSF